MATLEQARSALQAFVKRVNTDDEYSGVMGYINTSGAWDTRPNAENRFPVTLDNGTLVYAVCKVLTPTKRRPVIVKYMGDIPVVVRDDPARSDYSGVTGSVGLHDHTPGNGLEYMHDLRLVLQGGVKPAGDLNVELFPFSFLRRDGTRGTSGYEKFSLSDDDGTDHRPSSGQHRLIYFAWDTINNERVTITGTSKSILFPITDADITSDLSSISDDYVLFRTAVRLKGGQTGWMSDWSDFVFIKPDVIPATKFSQLTDVDLTGLADLDGFYWDNAASKIKPTPLFASGLTVKHEVGGLEADVSAYSGVPIIEGGATSQLKYNRTATVAPSATDDSASGYSVGSMWFDVTADEAYICLDASAGAAVWVNATTTTLAEAYASGAEIVTGGNGAVTIQGGTGNDADKNLSIENNAGTETASVSANGRVQGTRLATQVATELTISSGSITVTASYHTVDTEGDASSDDLATINGGVEGDVIWLTAENAARTVVVKHGTGNIQTFNGTDITLDEAHKLAAALYDGTNWNVFSFKQILSGDLATNSVITGKIAPDTEMENPKVVKLTGDVFVEYYGDESDFAFFRFVQRVSSVPTVRADVGILPTSGNLFFNVFDSGTLTPILIERTTGTNTTLSMKAAVANTHDLGAIGAEYRTLHLGTSVKIFNTSDPTAVSSFIFIYSKDDAGTAECYVIDAAGNVTKISPHWTQGDLIPAEAMASRPTSYILSDENVYTGTRTNMDVWRALEDLQTITGNQYNYVAQDTPPHRKQNPMLQRRRSRREQYYARQQSDLRARDLMAIGEQYE